MAQELSENDKSYLLGLSRKALEYYFQNKEEYQPSLTEIPKELLEKAATFVTLTIDGDLRGCIGKLEAEQELYKDVIENTYLAAFNDYRFSPLAEEELADIKIEISILTKPEVLEYSDAEDLLAKIGKEKPGLIIKLDNKQATFLPQVWEDLPQPEEFLSELCRKASLYEMFWKTAVLSIWKYYVVSLVE